MLSTEQWRPWYVRTYARQRTILTISQKELKEGKRETAWSRQGRLFLYGIWLWNLAVDRTGKVALYLEANRHEQQGVQDGRRRDPRINMSNIGPIHEPFRAADSPYRSEVWVMKKTTGICVCTAPNLSMFISWRLLSSCQDYLSGPFITKHLFSILYEAMVHEDWVTYISLGAYCELQQHHF